MLAIEDLTATGDARKLEEEVKFLAGEVDVETHSAFARATETTCFAVYVVHTRPKYPRPPLSKTHRNDRAQTRRAKENTLGGRESQPSFVRRTLTTMLERSGAVGRGVGKGQRLEKGFEETEIKAAY